jgi:DNA-binding FadR family transcriptional regulator
MSRLVEERPAGRGDPVTSDSTLIQHRSLTERTVERLVSDIMSNQLGEDDSLPSARELSDRYGVSVLVVREALSQLQAHGVLDKRQGRRTKVVRPDHTGISMVLKFATLALVETRDLQECRAGLEVKAVELAALSPRQDKREVLDPILRAMREATTAAEFNEHDLALHLAIAELSGNRPIKIFLDALRDVIRDALNVTYASVERRMGPSGIVGALEVHIRIADAVLVGEADAARVAMSEHFSFWDEQKPEPAR